jgi:hypothetical protein
VGVIKAFLHRGYNVSTTWLEFSQEIDRVKQLLTNNNYPMNLIDTTVNSFLSQRMNEQDSDKSSYIDIYFKNQMTSNYKQNEKQLRDAIEKTMSPSDPTEKVKLNIYYQNRKVRS